MDSQPTNSRREFIKTSGVVTAGAVASTILSLPKAYAADTDEIKAAVIGCGGRGRGAIANCLNAAGGKVKIWAIADAFESSINSVKKDKELQGKVDVPAERIFVGLDAYQKAINSGVDMVIIAGPPGFRPQHYEAAVKAGKHVFMEKPVCVCPGGFRKVMEANKLAEEKNLKVGVGLQRHHESGYLGTMEAIANGKFGDLTLLRAYWNGNGIWNRKREPGMTELQYQVNNWYHFVWLSGDNICEQHIHNLDVCNWAMSTWLKKEGKDWAHPVEANGMGGSTTRGYNGKDVQGQLFDTHFVEFTYENGTKCYSQCRHQPGTKAQVGEAIHSITYPKGVGGSGQGPKLKFGNPYDQEHYDLQQAIKENKPYHEGWYGAMSSMTSVLGRMATYSGQPVKWDDLVKDGADTFPEEISSWDSKPPVMPDEKGFYPIPIPGMYKIEKRKV